MLTRPVTLRQLSVRFPLYDSYAFVNFLNSFSISSGNCKLSLLNDGQNCAEIMSDEISNNGPN